MGKAGSGWCSRSWVRQEIPTEKGALVRRGTVWGLRKVRWSDRQFHVATNTRLYTCVASILSSCLL